MVLQGGVVLGLEGSERNFHSAVFQGAQAGRRFSGSTGVYVAMACSCYHCASYEEDSSTSVRLFSRSIQA